VCSWAWCDCVAVTGCCQHSHSSFAPLRAETLELLYLHQVAGRACERVSSSAWFVVCSAGPTRCGFRFGLVAHVVAGPQAVAPCWCWLCAYWQLLGTVYVQTTAAAAAAGANGGIWWSRAAAAAAAPRALSHRQAVAACIDTPVTSAAAGSCGCRVCLGPLGFPFPVGGSKGFGSLQVQGFACWPAGLHPGRLQQQQQHSQHYRRTRVLHANHNPGAPLCSLHSAQ
jgi:hypothetical protein